LKILTFLLFLGHIEKNTKCEKKNLQHTSATTTSQNSRTENVLHEAGISTLAEIREQGTARIAITNESTQ
jgi:hypothetical protein